MAAKPAFAPGTFNIERTDSPSYKLHDRLMLGQSCSREVAEWWLVHHYQARYPQFEFALYSGAPAKTCAIPSLN